LNMPIKDINKRLYEIQLLVKDGKISNVGAYAAKSFGV